MGHVIAVSGKGGVGKTTLCGLLIQYLCESGKRPVLAVDADANANLNEVLGVEPEVTLGELREEIERAGIDPRYQIPSGMTKQAYLEMRLSDAIAEEDDYDLMVMGRTQGQGCYCFVNGLVQTQVQKLQSHYPYIVVDNEAGMEHISRGILPMMEVAILVSDCSRRGVQAAGRIAKLMNELNFKPINEQISNFAQTYPTNLKASSNEALLFMRRYRFANCSCFSCCFKDAYPSSNVQ